MSVEILEERRVEVLPVRANDPRCADLGGAAIACAGCPFVRFCELKAAVAEVDTEVEKPIEAVEADWPDLFDQKLDFELAPETDLFADSFLDEAPAEKIETTPLPHDVENTTQSYLGRLMDDDVEVVFADSIAPPPRAVKLADKSELSRSDEPAARPGREVESESVVEAKDVAEPPQAVVEAIQVKPEPDVATELPVVAKIEVVQEQEAGAAAPVEKMERWEEREVETLVPYPEAIFDNTLTETEVFEPESDDATENLTQNILRPIVDFEIDDETKPEIFDEAVVEELVVDLPEQSPAMEGPGIMDAEDDSEIIDEAADEPFAEVVDVDEPETIELFKIHQASPRLAVSEGLAMDEGAEYAPEIRLAEALLNGEDMIDPEQRLVASKKKTRWSVLRELAQRALICSF